MAYDGIEVEIRIRVARDEAKEITELLAICQIRTTQQCDTYYDKPSRAFTSIEPIEEWLSCRQRGDTTRLNHKKFQYSAGGQTINCQEVDVEIESFASGDSLLRALGFEPVTTVEKIRTEGLIDDVLVAVDVVASLGTFVELEATRPHGNYNETRDYLLEFASKFGIKSRAIDNRGYPYLLLRK